MTLNSLWDCCFSDNYFHHIFFQYINGLNLHKKHTKAWWLQAGVPPRHVTHAQCNCHPISRNLIQIHESKFCKSFWVHVGFCGRNFVFSVVTQKVVNGSIAPQWNHDDRWKTAGGEKQKGKRSILIAQKNVLCFEPLTMNESSNMEFQLWCWLTSRQRLAINQLTTYPSDNTTSVKGWECTTCTQNMHRQDAHTHIWACIEVQKRHYLFTSWQVSEGVIIREVVRKNTNTY